MTVSVASRRIDRLHRISEPGRLVLGLIVGGTNWLDWATGDPRARYHFDDENALIAGVQSGLHASPLLLLPAVGVMIGLARLMTFSLADLRVLAKAERPGNAAAAAALAQPVLTANGLVTQSALAGVTASLTDLDVADAPLFQCMAFDDRLALYGLFNPDAGAPGATAPVPAPPPAPVPALALRQDAARFAVGQSRTPLEFGDYYRAYLTQVTALAAQGESTDDRAALVQAALDTLEPLLFQALDCPRVDEPVAPWDVTAAIDEWLLMGRRLGFSRLSQGVQQVITYAGFRDQDDEEAERIVGAYLAGAQALLMSSALEPAQIGQDGATSTYRVQSSTQEAIIALGADGIITLSSFRQLPQQPAVPPTT